MDLKIPGKVIIVTGAASGIGAAIVKEFLQSDALGLVAVDISKDLSKIFDEEKEIYGHKLQFITGDVSKESTAKLYTETAFENFGRIDVMINNAAISVVKSVIEHSPDEWDQVMNVNVKSIYWSARCVVPIIDMRSINFKELTVLGSRVYTRKDFEQAIELSSHLPLTGIVSHRLPLSDVTDAFRLFKKEENVCKVLLNPHRI